MRRVVLAAALLAAGGCSGSNTPATPPGEERQLNEAAASLDAKAAEANDAEIVDEPEGNGE